MEIRARVSRLKGVAWPRTLFLLAAGMALLSGCSGLLPSSKEETISAWDRFDEIKAAYDKITIGNSRAELKELGFDVTKSANVEVLNYLDVAAKVPFVPMAELDPGLQKCLRSHDICQAYVYDLRHLRGKRVGNFWADFLNFRRKTDTTGWRFNALLVMVDDQLTYKLWSGHPRIEIFKEDRNPLGPLQGFGPQVIDVLPWK